MEELLQQLKEKAGLTEEQSLQSLHVIKDYIRSKVPPMMHGLIDNFLGAALPPDMPAPASAKTDTAADADKVTEEAKEKIEGIAQEAKENVEEFAKEATQKIDQWAEKSETAARDAVAKLKGMMNEQKGS
jgi:hypothetical protein